MEARWCGKCDASLPSGDLDRSPFCHVRFKDTVSVSTLEAIEHTKVKDLALATGLRA